MIVYYNNIMEFYVFGQKIKVEKIKNLCEKECAFGLYNTKTKTIQVDTRLKGDELINTYLHELIHALCDRIGLNNAQFSHDLEEILADNIPVMITENFNVKIKCKKKTK